MDRYSQFLLHALTSKDAELPDWENKRDYWHVLRLASSNRVLYSFCKALVRLEGINNKPDLKLLCEKILKKGDEKIAIFSSTLNRIQESFGQAEIPFLIAKTAWKLPYIFNDIDLLVKPAQYQRAVEILASLQRGKSKHWVSADDKDLFEAPDFYKIDLHYHFSWLSSTKPFVDPELAWLGTEERDLFGVKCSVPNPTFEWMVNALNLMFERFHITLNGCLTLRDSFSKIDTEIIREQATKYRWSGTLGRFIAHLNALNRTLGMEEIEIPGVDCRPIKPSRQVGFPYIFPRNEVVRAYGEQWVRRKITDPKMLLYNLVYSPLKSGLSRNEKVAIYGDWYPFDKEPARP